VPKFVVLRSQLQSVTGYGLENTEVCVVLGSKYVAFFMSKNIKQRAVIKFLTQENEIFIGVNRKFLAFYGEDTVNISTVRCWVGKSRNIDESFNSKNQPLS
jgi:hypothetical protein